jgi:hypothetical protein
MALLTAKGIASVEAALLVRSLVLPNTVTIIPGGEYAGPNGDTITVRVTQPGAARTQETRGATITYDDVNEVPVDVQLSHLYHGKLISDEERSLDLESFARQIARVQIAAVATGAEDELAGVMNTLTADASFDETAAAANTRAGVLTAREFLGRENTPADGRWLAVSPEIATRLLSVPDFVKANEAGSTTALRQAVIGAIFGMQVVESAALAAGTAVAYHESGFAFANRVPVAPNGAAESATFSQDGLGVRHIFQYVPDKLSDASVVSTFAGASAVVDEPDSGSGTQARRYFKFTTSESGSGSGI